MQEPTRAYGNGRLAASDQRRSTGFHVRTEPIQINDKRYWWQTFPTEPSWWHDDRERFRHLAVVAEFEWSGIGDIVTELREMLRLPLRLARKVGHDKETEQANLDQASQLVRRCLSLCWMAEVALEHLVEQSGLEGIEYMCRYNEVRAAERLAIEGWRVLLDLPVPVIIAAVREAVARPDELYEADEP